MGSGAYGHAPIATYKSIIAYDGTDFHGFQRQSSNQRTVQGEFEKALKTLGWRGRSLTAAGRTDAGVHAQGQVVAFPMDWNHKAERLSDALNANLPGDISVYQTEIAPEGFHPRFSAVRRRYHYRILLAPISDPFRERYASRIWPQPDWEIMSEVAAQFVGLHDFGAFGRAPQPGGATTREVFQARWHSDQDERRFVIEANAYLNKMIRRLVGAMLEVGTGRRDSGDVLKLLDDPASRWEGDLAPPRGLCLDGVIYED